MIKSLTHYSIRVNYTLVNEDKVQTDTIKMIYVVANNINDAVYIAKEKIKNLYLKKNKNIIYRGCAIISKHKVYFYINI